MAEEHCFNINIHGEHNPTNFNFLKYGLTIMFFMSIYYLVINIKQISIIKSIYPPLFDFIDRFNGCIESKDKKKSMSVWYLLYLIVYIVLYASIIIFIYMNIEGLFEKLGHAVYVFILMMIYLYIIINRIVFYDQCFDNSEKSNSCFHPKCNSESNTVLVHKGLKVKTQIELNDMIIYTICVVICIL